MSHTTMIDTLAYANDLKRGGVPEKQAETHAHALAKIVDNQLVTKNYLKLALTELEIRLLTKMGAMLVGVVGILAAIIKF